MDDEVVLSGADSGRCHTGRQFRGEGLRDLHVSGPEFSRGDRLERGEVFFIVPSLLSRTFYDYVTADPSDTIDTSSRKNNWDARRGTSDDLCGPTWRIVVSFVDDRRAFHPRVNWLNPVEKAG